jgi:cathepsin X
MSPRSLVLATALLVTSPPCADAFRGYAPFSEPVEQVVTSPRPHDVVDPASLPKNFDWRNVNGSNFCGRVLNQKNPRVCGSCWAEAATGALTDRFLVATGGKLQVTLAPQNLLNFDSRITGGGCGGGDSLKAYEFIYKYGISDDTCTPYFGADAEYGFEVSDLRTVGDVSSHQCWSCDWGNACAFKRFGEYDLYGVDEFGTVLGEAQMQAEIAARGPIACSLNSEATAFNDYRGGIIADPGGVYDKYTDHVVVIGGWGVDATTNTSYWVRKESCSHSRD